MAEPKPAAAPARKKVTIPMLVEKMKKGEPIVQLAGCLGLASLMLASGSRRAQAARSGRIRPPSAPCR